MPELYASKALVHRANEKHVKWAMESSASQYAMAYRATWEIQGWSEISVGLRAVPGLKEILDPAHFRDLTIGTLHQSLKGTSGSDISPALLAVGFLIIGEVCYTLNDGRSMWKAKLSKGAQNKRCRCEDTSFRSSSSCEACGWAREPLGCCYCAYNAVSF